MEYLLFKWLHVLFSTVLFGTGIGSAFYLLVATLSRDLRFVAGVTRWVVRADWLFTATTAVLQPLSGLWMLHLAQIPLSTPWVRWSLILYAVAIGCWLPVVWLQIRMRDLARVADAADAPLPARYWRYQRLWFVLGIPAFSALVVIFWLMLNKP